MAGGILGGRSDPIYGLLGGRGPLRGILGGLDTADRIDPETLMRMGAMAGGPDFSQAESMPIRSTLDQELVADLALKAAGSDRRILGMLAGGVMPSGLAGATLAEEDALRAQQAGMELGPIAIGAGPALGMMKAWHASPHDFSQVEISPRTIGTGQGARSYGEGFYAAEARPVAQSYYDEFGARMTEIESAARARLADHRGNRKAAIAEIDDMIAERGQRSIHDMTDADIKLQEVRMLLASGKHVGPRMYKLGIKAEREHFLDWDKPLEKQSPLAKTAFDAAAKEMTGKPATQALFEAFKSLRGSFGGNPKAVADKLRTAGVAGIRYKDQGSRGKGAGTHNYVLFDDKIISILKKYGLAGLTGGLGAAAASQSQPSQETY